MSQITSESQLVADALRKDDRIREAKRLIREAVEDHAQSLEIRPSKESLKNDYEAWLSRLTLVRGGPPIWPYLSSGVGRGPYVELADGSVKLDFICGIGVHGAGPSD
ncbi:MAG: aspartate aminotransferase family protein, partial [Planctomycetota bacterium]